MELKDQTPLHSLPGSPAFRIHTMELKGYGSAYVEVERGITYVNPYNGIERRHLVWHRSGCQKLGIHTMELKGGYYGLRGF